MLRWLWWVASCALVLQLSAGSADARADGYPAAPASAALKHPKMSSTLVALAAQDASALARGGTAAPDVWTQVEIIAAGDRAAAEARVAALGGDVLASWADLIDARVPASALAAVAASPDVRYVRDPRWLDRHAVTDEAVAATGASAWHAAKITGAGVKIAILDFGFSAYQKRQKSGDLPNSVVTKDLCGGLAGNGETHGTGVAEIVHKMAPGASLYLACHRPTVASLGEAADWAISQGVDVINWSGGGVGQSRGDGLGGVGSLDGLAAKARAAGILWVNSSGNFGQGHWKGTFDPDSRGYHQFKRGDVYNRVTIAARAEACFTLRWDSWPATSIDYDLYLVKTSSNRIVAVAEDEQSGTQAPSEQLCYKNPGSSAKFGLVIADTTVGGSAARPRIDLFTDDVRLERAVAEGSLADPAASADVLSVGAICWNQKTIASYSSRGPTVDGRAKPDIAGPATVSTATYGRFTSCTGRTGFSGTSASAPHVSGAAALVLQANPTFPPSAVQAFLEGQALDLGTPGKDPIFGAGKLTLRTPGATTP